jgi:hypothetical protein
MPFNLEGCNLIVAQLNRQKAGKGRSCIVTASETVDSEAW